MRKNKNNIIICTSYRNSNYLVDIQGIVAQTPQAKEYREQRYREIYGYVNICENLNWSIR